MVFDLLDAGLEHPDCALLLVDLVVDAGLQTVCHAGELGEPAVGLTRRGARDDERRARFVDEDRVDLVDDREEVAALHHVGGLPRHVVAQVVEAELVVRAVGDVGGVLRTTHLGGLAREDAARRHAEGAENATHELALVAREVVVDRDDVHAARRNGVEVRRRRGHEGLALARLHLGDVAEVQSRSAHELYVEVTHAERALRGLAHSGESLGQQVVERLTVTVALAQFDGLVAQLIVGEVAEVVFELVDGLGIGLQPPKNSAFADPQNTLENIRHFGHSTRRATHGAVRPGLGTPQTAAEHGPPMLASAAKTEPCSTVNGGYTPLWCQRPACQRSRVSVPRVSGRVVR